MIQDFLESLTINTIALYVLGVGFLLRHFYLIKKQYKSNDLVIYDEQPRTLKAKLDIAKIWLVGICFLILSSFSIYSDLRNATLSKNLEIIQETLALVQSPSTVRSKREAVVNMEVSIDYSLLEKRSAESIKEWYKLSQGLVGLNHFDVPICVQLYEIYEAAEFYDKLESLDRIYSEFYRDYWGADFYDRKRTSHNRRRYRSMH